MIDDIKIIIIFYYHSQFMKKQTWTTVYMIFFDILIHFKFTPIFILAKIRTGKFILKSALFYSWKGKPALV